MFFHLGEGSQEQVNFEIKEQYTAILLLFLARGKKSCPKAIRQLVAVQTATLASKGRR